MKNLFLLSICLFFFSCKKENEITPEDDNELITSVELEFKSDNKSDFVVKGLDKNGDGVFEMLDPITLDRNTSYEIEVGVYDDSKSPKVDVTEDIESESDVHLFVYQLLPSNLGTFLILDKDKNGLPFGRKVKLSTSSMATEKPSGGKFRIMLKHQPPVNGKVVKTGDPNVGSTDIDLTFDLVIK
ncbi:hypothetical protein V7S76_10955 [Aquirufa sp. ROCK2-A2]